MGLFITLLILAVVFIVFIKKGRDGKSFYKYRKDTHDFVAKSGGMLALYEEFADYFRKESFNIREVTKDSMYLHYGSDRGKVGIQLIQNAIDEVEVIVSTEKPGNLVSKSSFTFDSEMDQYTMINSVLQSSNLNNSPKAKNTEQKTKATATYKKEDSKPEVGYSTTGAIGEIFLFIFLFLMPFVLAGVIAEASDSGAAGAISFIVIFIGVVTWYMNRD